MNIKTRGLILFLVVIAYCPIFTSGQTIELTFTAENNGQYVPLDSILIDNLSQGGDTTLYVPDTVLVLENVSGIDGNDAISRNTFYVSQNYPNPFKDKTEVNLYIPGKEYIKITVRDILGRELAQYENSLDHGNHSFAFYPANEKYYLLTVTGKQTSKTIKMLNSSSTGADGGKCKIVYNGFEDNENVFKSQQAITDFVYNLGDELQFTAYALTEIGNIGSAIETDSPVNNTTYEFNILGGVRCLGEPTVTDIDGNEYNTVLIGDQCWMKENLKTTTYQNGNAIPNVPGSWYYNNSGAYIWYNNNIYWKDLYGALYNWYAVADTNGICPTGWHVPTDDEWTTLTDFIGGAGSPHGKELKSCRQVNSPMGGGCNTTEHPRWSQDNNNWGTDDYGLSFLPGGIRLYDGGFIPIGLFGNWWSYTWYSTGIAWTLALSYEESDIGLAPSNMQHGFSVRCLRDN